jgi:hypothetical protein
MTTCVEQSVLPTIIYPSTLSDYLKQLLPNARATDMSIKACASLDSVTRAGWDLFYAALSGFAQEDHGVFGLGTAMDRAECYGAELQQRQLQLSKTCTLAVPVFNPGSNTSNFSKIMQYAAWGVGAFAFAYAIGKVADVVVPLLPKRKAA